jgi:cytochrome c-type biogenesis protein CcmH/NrfG
VIENAPEFPESYRKLGALYFELAHFEKAVIALNRALVLSPDQPDVRALLNRALEKSIE